MCMLTGSSLEIEFQEVPELQDGTPMDTSWEVKVSFGVREVYTGTTRKSID